MWNRFMFYSLTHYKRKRMVMYDARHESQWVQQMTEIALDAWKLSERVD